MDPTSNSKNKNKNIVDYLDDDKDKQHSKVKP